MLHSHENHIFLRDEMMDDFIISFKSAVLAREKGYDIINEYCYDPECRDVNHIYNWCEEIDNSTDGRMKRLVAAPTQSLLQRWLREKHRIDIVMHYNDVGDEEPYMAQLPQYSFSDCEYFPSYEEALEAGLREALNQL